MNCLMQKHAAFIFIWINILVIKISYPRFVGGRTMSGIHFVDAMLSNQGSLKYTIQSIIQVMRTRNCER